MFNHAQFILRSAAIGLAAAFFATPSFAQHSLLYEQPNVGDLHAKEAMLESKLTSAYNLGLIDPLELANMHRDLDAIRVKEDSYRMRGFSSGGYDSIASRLARFEADLNGRCGEKSNVIAVPVIEYR